MRLSPIIAGLLLAGSIFLSGCGGTSQSNVEVTGVVSYYDQLDVTGEDTAPANVGRVGKPISGAKVTFHSQGEPVGYGITDGLGRFEIRTYYHVAEPVDGLPLGLYAVTVTKLSLIEKSPSDRPAGTGTSSDQVLPARYSDPGTTEWKAIEVSSAKEAKNHFHLTVSGQ